MKKNIKMTLSRRRLGQTLKSTNVALLGVALAICLHFNIIVTIFSVPVRLALADLILPLALFFSVMASARTGLRRLRWLVPNFDLLLIGFLAWFAVSCFVGWFYSGQILVWAWGPKLLGTLVLVGYLLAGLLVAEAGEEVRNSALLAFVATAWIVSLTVLVRFFVEINGAYPFGQMQWRPVGFSGNPNALAILLGTALIIQIFTASALTRVPQWIAVLGLAFITAAIFLTGSRSSYLGFVFSLPLMFIFWERLDRRVLLFGLMLSLPILLIASIDCDFFAVDTPIANSKPLGYASRNPIVVDSGVSQRWQATTTALELWREAPILGIGIGGFAYNNRKHDPGSFNTLHTSALWLLVETGIVGLLLFGCILALLGWFLMKRACNSGDEITTAICVVLAFAVGASLGTEVIYQRYLWFLVGMVVALPGSWTSVFIARPLGLARSSA
jgi:O-antigen ligase